MPPRRTPEQYAAVAAAGEPPRSDDPRFTTDDDSWHRAQNEWHEKVRAAFGYDELSPPGISERRKEWQTAIKTAAAFRKKLAEDPTLAHPRDEMDDGTTRNERRAQQRREQKAHERQRQTAYQRSRLVQEMQCKPFAIRTLFAFGDDECHKYDRGKIGVSPEGIICTSGPSVTDHRGAPPTLYVLSPAGVRQCSFSAQAIEGILGIVCSSTAIFVSGSLHVGQTRSVVQKYDYEGTLLCSTRSANAGHLWLVDDALYTAKRGLGYSSGVRGHFAILSCTDLQQIGGFANITPDSHKSEEELAEKLRNPYGYQTHAETESLSGLAVHGDELFVASEPADFRGFSRTPRINVFTRDGTFLRRLELPVSGVMAAQSAEHGPILVTFCSDHVCTYKLDGTALHRIRFASTPYDATALGSRIYVATREGDYPDAVLRFMCGIKKEFDYDLPAAQCVNGVRTVDIEF